MADSRRHAVRGFPWLTASLLAVGAVVSLAAVASSVLTVVVARTVVTPPRRRPEDVSVLSVDLEAGTITLNDTPVALLPGEYSFWFAAGAGHAKLGEIIRRSGHTVTRRVISVDSGDLTKATRGRINGWFFLTPAELGVPFENVEIATEFGPAPAWLVPAAEPSTRWVIQVHGRAVRRAETIRAIPVFRDAGYTSLLISYRNDGEAPPSLDGRYGLGDTEWRDVEAAIQYAVDHGATDVVLMGWSMGGATVLQAVTRSGLAGVVRGLVLDSPVVDWVTALRFQGQLLRLPVPVRSGVISLIGAEWARRLTGQGAAIDIRRLDFVRRSDELDLPILLMHSDDDGFIPPTASRALAEARPDIVTFESFSGAHHTKLWNYDPPRWNAAIARWLATAPLAAPSGD
ncbi:alpha/beta hydrolase family protein [Lacisediminihabitans sp.]|uniref:alpha/beta hydrolase family protein n=1 Tax=Lacisediminihabitans sp. TaxID=2787631 RepID=UPI002F91F2EC